MTDLADALGVADSVDFVGQVADTDRLLGESSVVLAPAPEEPFGLSVVEAMAHGVPVVAADGGAHPRRSASPICCSPPATPMPDRGCWCDWPRTRPCGAGSAIGSGSASSGCSRSAQHLDGLEAPLRAGDASRPAGWRRR